jgi:hypothetical protein
VVLAPVAARALALAQVRVAVHVLEQHQP